MLHAGGGCSARADVAMLRDVRSRAALAVMVAIACPAELARADDYEHSFATRPGGPYLVDGGFFVGMPAALPAGMAPGAVVGVQRACGCAFAYGVRLAVAAITESSEAYTASDIDMRARATAAVRHAIGRGDLALRLGVGTNVVYEDRTRNGGTRAGLTGSALETQAVAALPAADLEAVIGLHVAGPWLFVATGGPTIDVLDGHARGGWIASIGVGWQP